MRKKNSYEDVSEKQVGGIARTLVASTLVARSCAALHKKGVCLQHCREQVTRAWDWQSSIQRGMLFYKQSNMVCYCTRAKRHDDGRENVDSIFMKRADKGRHRCH